MKTIWLILTLAASAVICIAPAFGDDDGYPDQEDGWIVSDSGEALGAMTPVSAALSAGSAGGVGGSGDGLRLAFVDTTGKETKDSLEMSSGSRARLLLRPEESGRLELFCRYPTGSSVVILNQSVQAGTDYTTLYQAELEGEYELWFEVDGSKSNSIKAIVTEYDVMEESMSAYASAGAQTGTIGSMSRKAYSLGPPAMALASPAPVADMAMAPGGAGEIGFSVGGAKDVASFRENINQSYLPLPSDLTYEGLFYDYYFDTGAAVECKKLFCPAYSSAVSKDPFSGVTEYYLTVGMNSGIADFHRKKLNLVVVLDFSGSMGSPFDEYYYDQPGNTIESDESEAERSKTKMQIADEAVSALIDHLGPGDRFGMVLFSDEAFLLDPLTGMEDKDVARLKSRILRVKETYGTNMEAGIEKGTALFEDLLDVNRSEYENRIIFLTDAMPNLGETGDLAMYRMLEDNSDDGIYTTFIGIGIDFNSELVESITKVKGANYYSVHSSGEFKKRLGEEFEFMVTPLVFDLKLKLDAPGYEIAKVYGSPEADQATGELLKVNTLFPSKAEEGAVRGGVVLVKLKRLPTPSQGAATLSVSYEDRNGVRDKDEAVINLAENAPDFYANNGIRKAVLLSRYADLLKNWMIDERGAIEGGWQIVPSVTLSNGIVVPVELGEWERQSLPLTVSGPYPELFGRFLNYYEVESQAIGDSSLEQEKRVMERLRGSGGWEMGV